MNYLYRKLAPNLIYALLIIPLLALAIPASASNPALQPTTAVALNKTQQSVVDGNNAFALDLYRKFRNRNGNIFYSPYSISTALAMSYGGARGETAEQMKQTLHFSAPQDKLHSSFNKLQETLEAAQAEGSIQLAVANSLWPAKRYSFLDSYLGLLKEHYDSEVTPLDYPGQPEKSRHTINQWVENKTHNRIKNLLQSGSITGATRMVLVNAIYFKGAWATPFLKKDTTTLPFFPTHSKSVDVPMMHQTDNFNYYADNQAQVLELPYAGNDLSMLIILPKQHAELSRIESELSTTKLNSWISNMKSAEVSAWIPKFKTTITYTLNKTLRDLGMIDAFCDGSRDDCSTADFSGMDGTHDLSISSVLHKAFIEVNEEGTEAAAATATVMVIGGMLNPPPVEEFRADHPFIFLIRDKRTDSILFVGRMTNPEA
jgi:serpin B